MKKRDDRDNEIELQDDASELDPFEINFLPQFQKGRGPRNPFVNQYGVVIGDHDYESEDSPLENWTEDTDPSIMAGDDWVHPFKDIGFHSAENRDYFEKGIPPQSGIFEHADKNVAYKYEQPKDKDNGERSAE
ncbi:DUF3905 domain-containing protein [Paenibacillus thalictri]|uniref:DUF3905 domain-containing protein n=1 Tax=Paenibacillus thalictri TaxID=2527873 RepID=UPI00269CFCE3